MPISAAHHERKSSTENFMRQFRDKTNHDITNLTATQLLMIWNHYDADGNGYIEGEELNKFLREFVSSVCHSNVGSEVISDSMFDELKTDFMEAYDENEDGRIEVRELAQLLPVDENFLLLFFLDKHVESSVDFMHIWKQYDQDNSGYIEALELKNFLQDLFDKCKPAHQITDDQLQEYTDAILALFDENNDGRLSLSEMSRLLPVKENALQAALSSNVQVGARRVSILDLESIFSAYDKDDNGEIEGDELSGFIKDFLSMLKPSYTSEDLAQFQAMLMKSCDLDRDGKISREEMTMLLLGLQQFSKKFKNQTK